MTQLERIGLLITNFGADIKAIYTALNGKEPAITAGTSAQFWIGNKTWATILTTVLNVVLTGLSVATSTAVVATDTIVVAIGKLQAQITLRQNLNPSIKAYTATANTLILTDNGQILTVSNAAANTLTVPQNSSVAFPIGTSLPVIQIGAGQTTIVAGTGTPGTTLRAPNGLKFRAQYSTVFLMKIATDTWVVGGDTAV